MNKSSSKWEKAQEGRELENRCWASLKPVLEDLHQMVDHPPSAEDAAGSGAGDPDASQSEQWIIVE